MSRKLKNSAFSGVILTPKFAIWLECIGLGVLLKTVIQNLYILYGVNSFLCCVLPTKGEVVLMVTLTVSFMTICFLTDNFSINTGNTCTR